MVAPAEKIEHDTWGKWVHSRVEPPCAPFLDANHEAGAEVNDPTIARLLDLGVGNGGYRAHQPSF
jgi:hypothetical protein